MRRTANDTYKYFIPLRKIDLFHLCLKNCPIDELQFSSFYKLIDNLVHYEFKEEIDELKKIYDSLDPNADTLPFEADSIKDTGFEDKLIQLLTKANYHKIPSSDLNQALEQDSLFKIKLQVNLTEFEDVVLFYRGKQNKKEIIASFFGLIKKPVDFINFERVVIYLKTSQFDNSSTDKSSTYLKLFQNVPQADIEMLFPNTRIRMRLLDKLIIGVPAVISGGIVFTTKVGASLILLGSLFGFWLGISKQPVEMNETALIALLAGVGALGGYIWKQLNVFKNRKIRFMKALTENLYFRNLDNNAGVLFRIANDAEDEETKEILLAYYSLVKANKSLTKEQLDQLTENWLREHANINVDFDVQDALNKLIRFGLVIKADNEYNAIRPDQAIRHLQARWDSLL